MAIKIKKHGYTLRWKHTRIAQGYHNTDKSSIVIQPRVQFTLYISLKDDTGSIVMKCSHDLWLMLYCLIMIDIVLFYNLGCTQLGCVNGWRLISARQPAKALMFVLITTIKMNFHYGPSFEIKTFVNVVA